MDAHFREYLGAIAGMQELYGDRPDDCPTDFHLPEAPVAAAGENSAVSTSAAAVPEANAAVGVGPVNATSA
jgi:hypothetical protein